MKIARVVGMVIAFIVLWLIGCAANAGPVCDESLWGHVYHRQRLLVNERCVSVTGTLVDATDGKVKDGCRHEADGDGHCWLRLDAGQEQFLFCLIAEDQTAKYVLMNNSLLNRASG